MITRQVAVAAADASQIGDARRSAMRAAEGADLDEQARGQVAVVATELATNLVRYGNEGRILIQPVASRSGWSIEMIAIDRGPGMSDCGRCLEDGYSTGGSSGTGLGAVRRMSEEFDLYSQPGSGTVVVSRIGGGRRPAGARTGAFRWAAVSTPAPNEEVCGDAWRISEQEGTLSLFVVDGLGHGPGAADAAARVVSAFETDRFEAPGPFIQRAHVALTGSRGAALAAAHVSAGRRIRYAGVGNISGWLVDGVQRRGLISQNGTAGLQIRRVQETVHEWTSGFFVMHSDGLSSRWSLDAYPGVLGRHPAVLAGLLHRDCRRGADDVTVVVVGAGTPRP